MQSYVKARIQTANGYSLTGSGSRAVVNYLLAIRRDAAAICHRGMLVPT